MIIVEPLVEQAFQKTKQTGIFVPVELPTPQSKEIHVFVRAENFVHAEKQRVEHNGMILGRVPTDIEKLINLKAIEDAFDSSEEELKSDIEKLKNKLVADAVEGIIALDPADYHTLTLEPDPKDLAQFRDDLQAIYDKGRALVVDELEQQGAYDVDTEFDISQEDDQALDGLAAVTVSKLANDVQSRVIGITATLVALGVAGALLKDKIFEAISKLSDAYMGAAAATASHVSLNTGRDATGAANAGIIKEVYYSSVLDENTCIPCQDADGETAESEGDLPDAPNPDCDGWGRCRCIHVFVYEGEQKFNPNHDERGRFAEGQSVSAQRTRAVSAFDGKPIDKQFEKPVQIISEHLFHGTSEQAWKLIQKNGLDPKADGQWILSNDTPERAASVYMTNDKDLAVYFGSFAARKLAEAQGKHGLVTPVILEIKVPKAFQDKIVLDDQVESSVMFKGKIPPEWIKRIPFNVAEPVMPSIYDKDDSKTIWAVLLVDGGPEAKFNPNHAPAGSPTGGQFTSGDGGPIKPRVVTTPPTPESLVVFHGTKDDLLKSIKEKGLIPAGSGIRSAESRYYAGDRALSVFMSKDKTEAVQWAEHAAYIHNDYYETPVHPLLLKIAIPKEFQDKIIIDPDAPTTVRLNMPVPPEWITPVDTDTKDSNEYVYAAILVDGEEVRPRLKFNPNHEPAGSPVGGQFTSGAGAEQRPRLLPANSSRIAALVAACGVAYSSGRDALADLENSKEAQVFLDQSEKVSKIAQENSLEAEALGTAEAHEAAALANTAAMESVQRTSQELQNLVSTTTFRPDRAQANLKLQKAIADLADLAGQYAAMAIYHREQSRTGGTPKIKPVFED